MLKNVLEIALWHAHDYAFKASNTIDKLRISEMEKKNQHKMRNVKGKEANIEIQQVVGFNFTLPSQIVYD